MWLVYANNDPCIITRIIICSSIVSNAITQSLIKKHFNMSAANFLCLQIAKLLVVSAVFIFPENLFTNLFHAPFVFCDSTKFSKSIMVNLASSDTLIFISIRQDQLIFPSCNVQDIHLILHL